MFNKPNHQPVSRVPPSVGQSSMSALSPKWYPPNPLTFQALTPPALWNYISNAWKYFPFPFFYQTPTYTDAGSHVCCHRRNKKIVLGSAYM